MNYDITSATMDALQQTRPPFAPTKLGRCPWCGCTFQAFDISGPNPIEDMCYEPLHDRKWGCDCHNPDFVEGYLDQRARYAEEVVMTI